MPPESRRGKKYGQVSLLAFWLGVAWSGALAQNQTIGKEFQGTIFSPALEDSSQSKSSALLSTLVVEGNYDSNLLSQAGVQLPGTFELVEGEFHYSLRHPGNDLLLSYTVGERLYPTISSLNGSLQDARLQWQRRVTNRLDFTIKQRWARLPAGAVLETNPEQGFPLLGSIPQGAIFLQQKFATYETNMSLTEKLTSHTVAILGFNYVDTMRSGTTLISTKEADAYGGVYYAPTRRQNFGVVYAQQWLRFAQGFGGSQTRSLFLSYSFGLTPTVSVSLFGGPSQVQQAGSVINNSGNLLGLSSGPQTIPQQTLNGFLGGVKIERRLRHNTLRANYTQLISGGAGFLATVLRQTAELNASHAMSPRLDISLGASYSQNAPIGIASQGFKIYYVEPGLRYRLTPHLRLAFRDSLGKATGLVGIRPILRNEASMRLEYTFPKISIRK